ncbi:[FeFe] hydrogenase H-cluster radical SAM maturase HydG [Candidatus Xianfuyuplasma coldseepsis]|uniref:[FeFe] hydrogenase H-cluster radical SAM maturase HydG n=1 Tax=Candidatus Xianfuyuplasma coldseepsis TaxID=2782163 RepID=A0A7L7KS18_9MOLU|nr:[FeFe] hydrogenase H-cluster radical SAM maturase HydG [Xianfuyuplasma coldseepsis]QMS85395.1 [FeFe] hydrogenase H-cluster radical SAM maturase HydG [Xianfuyuplasma coldseepsis]
MIDKYYINKLLQAARHPADEEIQAILDKARKRKRLNDMDVAMLLNAHKPEQLEQIYDIAGCLKDEIYGSRVVIFAPLYISNYCVNNCKYCGYRRDNKFPRKKLTQSAIKEQAITLEKLGHKRLALEVGESPKETPIDYVVESIKTIYDNSSIRRINVNIAATTVDDYKKLKDVGIGTYILFQETYDPDAFKDQHPKSIKGDYEYHLHAFDRAFEAGIDDVGAGVLFGLANWKFEVMSLLIHNRYLEDTYGVGFHTISVPRLKKAEGMSLEDYPNIISDEQFKRLVTVLRLAVPYVGLILSTRETKEMREELIQRGVSQISAGSKTDVGGYHEDIEEAHEPDQFELSDERSVLEVNKDLISRNLIPSYCTACYRKGRTGDRFMRLAKGGTIGLICEPNALMTLTEYVMDYGDQELIESGLKFIFNHAEKIRHQTVKDKLKTNIYRIIKGERDLYF